MTLGSHTLAHTIIQQSQTQKRLFQVAVFSVVVFKTRLYFCPAAVWNNSLTPKEPPPFFSSLIKGVNNFPSLTVYYPLGQ